VGKRDEGLAKAIPCEKFREKPRGNGYPKTTVREEGR